MTLLGAVSLNDRQAVMTVEAATDGEVFLACLREVHCPTLQIGQVVMMDNLSALKVDGVRELNEATGAELRYLPPYSALLTSTPSNLAGRSSNSVSSISRLAVWPPSTKPFPSPLLSFLLPSPSTVSPTAAMPLVKSRIALSCLDQDIHRPRVLPLQRGDGVVCRSRSGRIWDRRKPIGSICFTA